MRRAFEEPGRWHSANTAENEENVASHAATVFVFPSDPAGPFHPPPWRAGGADADAAERPQASGGGAQRCQ